MLKVQRLFEDDWSGLTSDDQEYACDTLDQAIQVVGKLNGANKTLIELIIDESTFLTVGGGNQGRYVCYATKGDEIFNLITANHQDNEQVIIVAGGQHGYYDPKLCVSLDEVSRAVEAFCIHGEMTKDQTWEQQA